MKNNTQQEEWERRACTCFKDWLSQEAHYTTCPVLYVKKLLLQARKEAREEIMATEKILEDRSVLFEYIPECEAHGKYCVPHAIEWVHNIQKRCREAREETLREAEDQVTDH